MKIEDTLDQPVVVEIAAAVSVISRAEVKEEITFGSNVAPRFVWHHPEDKRREPVGRFSVADIDDAAVVQFVIAGTIRVLRTVKAAADGEREVGAGKQES